MGSFLNKNTYVSVRGVKNFIFNDLSLSFIKLDALMGERILSGNHEGTFSQIKGNRSKYGEFDYEKWAQYIEDAP